MASARSMKDKEMAAYLKKKGVTRHTGQCPWGCGHTVTNGGGALTAHLNICRGKSRSNTSRKVTR